MTQRKPPGMPWDNFIDRQIREAEARGEFDNLPGAGQPIPDLDKPCDEMWWVKGFLKREKLNLLPDALELKLEIERELARVAGLATEEEIRRKMEAFNARIRRLNATAPAGPGLGEIEAEAVVARWRIGK